LKFKFVGGKQGKIDMGFAIIHQEDDQIMKIPVSMQSYVIEIKNSYGDIRCFVKSKYEVKRKYFEKEGENV
jgi:hypothetical protein